MKKLILVAGFAGAVLAVRMSGGQDDVAKGKDVFDQCSVCHNVDTDEKKIGPSLKGLYKKAALKNGKKVTDANVMAIINAGGGGMPAYADTLTADEKKELLAYLKTI